MESITGLRSGPGEVNRDEAPAYWAVGILWTILADHESTDGQTSWMEELIPHGPSAPPHIHVAADEMFYILEGEATFLVGEEETPVKGRPGSWVTIPRGTRHSFSIDSETCLLLNGYTPAGFEHQIRAMARPAEARTLPPPDHESAFTPEMAARFHEAVDEVVAKYPAARTINLPPKEAGP